MARPSFPRLPFVIPAQAGIHPTLDGFRPPSSRPALGPSPLSIPFIPAPFSVIPAQAGIRGVGE